MRYVYTRDFGDIEKAAARKGVSVATFIAEALEAALKAADEIANGPWQYMVIGEDSFADQNLSRTFIHRSCCIEEAERHGAMQLSPHCEIVVIDNDKNSVLNGLFRYGKKVAE